MSAVRIFAARRRPASSTSTRSCTPLWEDDDDAEQWLDSIVPARAGLADGDLRLLYLGWLLAAQNGDLDDDELEPAVPPGMAELPESLQKFAEFLRIDDDLIAAAAENSADLGVPPAPEDPAVREWVQALAAKEKDDVILGLFRGNDPHLRSRLRQRFRAESGLTKPLRQRATGRPTAMRATGMRSTALAAP